MLIVRRRPSPDAAASDLAAEDESLLNLIGFIHLLHFFLCATSTIRYTWPTPLVLSSASTNGAPTATAAAAAQSAQLTRCSKVN